MPLSTQRLARNQAVFREVSERLRVPDEAVPDGRTAYLCECSNSRCAEKIELKPFEYEAVRARPKAFLVVSGHERLEVERVVDGLDGYTVVEKIVPLDGAATRALISTDEPRPQP